MASSTRVLFWDEEVPGKTQLMAAIISSDIFRQKTFYLIEVVVSTTNETGVVDLRTWQVRRRYSVFNALHQALTNLGFPCPELPPKQLWWGHTSTFMINRQIALNYWIQGVVIIWQSGAPTRPRVAYAIGELLEAFLCAADSETFYKILEEVQNEEKTVSDQDYEFETNLPELQAVRITDAAPSPFVQQLPSGSGSPEDFISPGANNVLSSSVPRASTTYVDQYTQNRRRSKRKSGTNPVSEDQASSFSDWPTLGQSLAVESSSSYTEISRDKISKSAPPLPAPFMAEYVPPEVPSVGNIGIAIDMTSSPSAQKNITEYITFDNYGQRVRHFFQPFTAKVVFGEGPDGREEVVRNSGMMNASTPVSVPPTPHAQNQFNAQWNQYTSSVLEFVQERLSIVLRNKEKRDFNILDRHHAWSDANANLSDNEEDGEPIAGTNGARKLVVINLREKNVSKQSQIDATESVEDADAGAGGSAQGGLIPPNHALAHSYVLAGEHLVNTILKESEADMLDWQFVSNTKDVVVMRRLRPIKKKNLLKIRGPCVTQPSPSPQISQGDKSRGMMTAPPPSALTLDGTSSAASSVVAPPSTSSNNPDQSQHCFMGRGIIDASAEEIFEIVRRPENRHFYESMLNEEITLENLAVGDEAKEYSKSGVGNVLVYYHMFETNRCFLRYARDFCVLQYARKVVIGTQVKYVVVGASINHANCPNRDDVERATLDLFGWVVEPTAKGNQSKVTYMMHIDFGRSGVPTHLLNTISFRQPLAVHYLRRHISNLPEDQRYVAEKKTASTPNRILSTTKN